jgi:hypothetical protein
LPSIQHTPQTLEHIDDAVNPYVLAKMFQRFSPLGNKSRRSTATPPSRQIATSIVPAGTPTPRASATPVSRSETTSSGPSTPPRYQNANPIAPAATPPPHQSGNVHLSNCENPTTQPASSPISDCDIPPPTRIIDLQESIQEYSDDTTINEEVNLSPAHRLSKKDLASIFLKSVTNSYSCQTKYI